MLSPLLSDMLKYATMIFLNLVHNLYNEFFIFLLKKRVDYYY